ncbi:MAG TPA: Flp pilus assembly protein CpaB [Paracoccaceae bacterium]
MRMLFGLVLVLGLALAGAAVYLAQGYISQTQAELAAERAARAKAGPLVEVFVVNKPLNYGDPLTKADVQKIYWPQSALPETIFTDVAKLFPEGEKAPRFVLRQMEKFEPLLAVKVTEPGEAAGLTGKLAKGQRAFTIKFDAASGMSRYLQPGNNVDVYWTGAVTSNGGDITQLIETAVEIIAVEHAAGEDQATNAPKTITVAASPQQVGRLAQGQATGRLSVSLVGQNDDTVAGNIEVDKRTLLGISEQMVEAAPVEKVCTIRTRRGAEVVEMPIACTN